MVPKLVILLLQQKILLPVILFLFSATIVHNAFAQTEETRPDLNQLKVSIKEVKPPENIRLSPFLLYDNHRNVLWTGDITSNSSKIIEFELNSGKFVIHKLAGTYIVEHIAIDSKGNLWYTDPFTNSLGQYDPDSNSNTLYPLPNHATPTGIAIDNSGNSWTTIPEDNKILEFDSQKDKFVTINLPATSSFPFAITSDKSGKIWMVEGLGKIASIDPTSHNVTEYSPSHLTFSLPTSIASDPVTGKIYFSEHNAYDVAEFDPSTKTFTKKYNLDFGGFPSGITFDRYDNLWVSQHTLDKVAVIDTATGQIKQFNLPQGSLVQYLASDSNGNIMYVNQRSNVLGIMTIAITTVPEFPQLSLAIFAIGLLLTLFVKGNWRRLINGMQ